MNILKIRLIGAALLALFLSSTAQAIPLAYVKVSVQVVGSKVQYSYRVTNNSPQGIAAFTIGYDSKSNAFVDDYDPDNDVHELSELPSGWDFYNGIPAYSRIVPPGWNAEVLLEEENPMHALKFGISDRNTPSILPDQTLGGFTIVLDKADDLYRTGHALIRFDYGLPATTVLIEPDDIVPPPPPPPSDVIPPTLTLTVNPTRLQVTAGKPVTVTATISVSDASDPAPVIRLESITANEPLAAGDITGAALGTDDRQFQLRDVKVPKGSAGRIYTITYSATDASGNKAMASATVAVK